jgi:hypothetical protein
MENQIIAIMRLSARIPQMTPPTMAAVLLPPPHGESSVRSIVTGVGVMSPSVVSDMPVVVARVEVRSVVRELVDSSVGL